MCKNEVYMCTQWHLAYDDDDDECAVISCFENIPSHGRARVRSNNYSRECHFAAACQASFFVLRLFRAVPRRYSPELLDTHASLALETLSIFCELSPDRHFIERLACEQVQQQRRRTNER
jgi:hypothetical protein